MRKLLPIALMLAAVAVVRLFDDGSVVPDATHPAPPPHIESFAGDGGETSILRAFQQRSSDLQVSASGIVDRVLADDLDGDRHQRFVLSLAGGQTVLVAHNIDLAPRISNLAVGDRVEFYGEYEWNAQGGVIHWTHHDPGGRHPDGWLRHNGRVYQ